MPAGPPPMIGTTPARGIVSRSTTAYPVSGCARPHGSPEWGRLQAGKLFSTREPHDQHAIRARSQGLDPHHSGLSQARDHVPRHHHAARQRARVPPRGRRAGAALGRLEDRQGRRHRGARLHPRRRGGAPGVGRASCRSARRASCRTSAVRIAYSLEYGLDEMEMHEDAVAKGDRVDPGRRSDRHRRHRRGRGQAAAPARRARCSPPASSSICRISAAPTSCASSTCRCAR